MATYGQGGGEVRLWATDVLGERPVKISAKDSVYAEYGPNSDTLTVVYAGGLVELWDMTELRPVPQLSPAGALPAMASLSPDGLTLAIAQNVARCERMTARFR